MKGLVKQKINSMITRKIILQYIFYELKEQLLFMCTLETFNNYSNF
jgi:hypothetical protein